MQMHMSIHSAALEGGEQMACKYMQSLCKQGQHRINGLILHQTAAVFLGTGMADMEGGVALCQMHLEGR